MKNQNIEKLHDMEYEEIIDKVNSSDIAISIITPNYNSSQFLPDLLNSLKKQTLNKK